jgi:peptidoglycan hydrolase CwlO-like protein
MIRSYQEELASLKKQLSDCNAQNNDLKKQLDASGSESAKANKALKSCRGSWSDQAV